ncbi:LysR substrate-binding domain-containing protein [Silicimonas sp. MF1-12-2]|uniref:LysR substrate-binding domain-containing protein n=1 Tax=Silicimonas sp. MF1-12-2 TaxID=3384793 RepID=UPI0039B3D938
MNQIRAMRVFLRVAELGSLTAASADLGYSRGMASTILNELETYLGVRLLERTTRAARLTEEGVLYAERARAILADIEALEDEVGASETRPRGRLRVQIPPGLLRIVVAPELPRFFADYPDVTLELLSRNRIPDFVGDRLDAAVFVGDLPDSALISRGLGRIPLLTLASPAYLERHGTPSCPADLARHRTIGILSAQTGQTSPWSFRNDQTTETFHPAGALAIENADAAVAAASGSLGIVQIASYLVYGEVKSGRLVPVLDDWRPTAFEARLLLPPGRLRPRKLRVFEAFLIDAGKRFRERWGIADVT